MKCSPGLLRSGLFFVFGVVALCQVPAIEFQFHYGVTISPASNSVASWPATGTALGVIAYRDWLAVAADYGAVRFPHVRLTAGYTHLFLTQSLRLRLAAMAGPALGYYNEELFPSFAASVLVSVGPPVPRFGWNFYAETYAMYSFRSDPLPQGYAHFLIGVSAGFAIRW